jgi:hypothetical protein
VNGTPVQTDFKREAGFKKIPYFTVPSSDDPPPMLSREEITRDCEDNGGALWVQDWDSDGLVPSLAITNLEENWVCVMSGTLGRYIHITNTNQIGLDADDQDKDVHFK